MLPNGQVDCLGTVGNDYSGENFHSLLVLRVRSLDFLESFLIGKSHKLT